MKTRSLLLAFVLFAMIFNETAEGQVSLTTIGVAYTQDFNTLASSGPNSSVPTGWAFNESGSNANTTYTAGTGSNNTGDTYSFGATSDTDRAFGGLQSSSLIPMFGASFTNNTGSPIASILIAYVGEQWRLGTRSRFDRLDFQYSLDATSLTTGTWTDVDDLDFQTPILPVRLGRGMVIPLQTELARLIRYSSPCQWGTLFGYVGQISMPQIQMMVLQWTISLSLRMIISFPSLLPPSRLAPTPAAPACCWSG